MVDTSKQVASKLKKDNDKLNKKLNKHNFELSKIRILIYEVLVKNQNSSPHNMYSKKYQDPNTMFPDNKNIPPLECGISMKIGGMWTLKHEIISPKFYDLPTKT